MAVLALTALVWSTVAPSASASGPVGTNGIGQWGPLEDWPLIAIHAVLLPDGDVMTYGTNSAGVQTGSYNYDIWDSSGTAGSGHTTLANTTSTDLFCSIQLVRPDQGDVILFGGDNWVTPPGTTTGYGNADILTYEPSTQTLAFSESMVQPRWYATAITLADGSIYLQGGEGADPGWEDEEGWIGPPTAEHWTEENGSVELPFFTGDLRYWYPRNFLLPDGRIFGFDTRGNMYYVAADLQSITHVGQFSSDYKGKGSSAVMYEPGKILQVSGSSDEAVIIDANGPTPVLTPTADLSSHRDWGETTLLPDGRVLMVGGSEEHNELGGVNYNAEIWDPDTGEWTVGAAGAVARLYHSTSLLLPDGRVLVAGGGAPGPLVNTNAEIYSPDYLVSADSSPMPRPAITGLSSSMAWAGDSLTVTVDDASDIDRITVLKTGSVTHSFNIEQRIFDLPFTAVGNDLTITLPANSNELTPGHYLVTVIDDEGIPSPSEIINVPVDHGPPEIQPGALGGPEGDTGSQLAGLPVRLDHPYKETVTVDWTTIDLPRPGLASPGSDFAPGSGTATFLPGETETTVPLTVFGDLDDEPGPLWGEWGLVQFSNPSPNATVNHQLFGLGILIIGNDDVGN